MTMVSTPTICVCPPRLPLPGASRKFCTVALSSLRRGTGGPKWVPGSDPTSGGHTGTSLRRRRPASPLFPCFSSSEDGASDAHGVPAEDTPGRHSTGSKTVKLVDTITATKFVDDQLPSLLTMVIDGFPPFKISKYVDEAEHRLHQYVQRYRNVISLDSYYHAGLSGATYGHPNVISLDCLVAIAMNYGLQFLLDDLFFDTPNEFLEAQYGIPCDTRRTPQNIQKYLAHLNAIFSQQVQPNNSAPLIETIVWETGQCILELTNLEWFNHYVASVMEFHYVTLTSHVDIVKGNNVCFQNVESYVAMRAGNIGGKFIQMMVELANDNYIPDILRTDPYVEKVTMATSIHIGLVNDIMSYHKESMLEQNPRNLISVLIECEGKPFVETVHKAIEMVNLYGLAIMNLEGEAWSSTLQNYLQGIKEVIAGNIYFSYMDYRYRHVDSVFPELRDITSSWKVLHAKRPEL